MGGTALWWDLTLLSFSEHIWRIPTIFLTRWHDDAYADEDEDDDEEDADEDEE